MLEALYGLVRVAFKDKQGVSGKFLWGILGVALAANC